VPTDRYCRADEIELFPFIHPAHDDQSGHNLTLIASVQYSVFSVQLKPTISLFFAEH
jgi:hypothetical protein